MTKVLVTGAAGFVGRAVVGAFVARGAKVLALPGRGAPADPDARATWGPPGDLARGASEAVAWAIREGPPDVVIHLAGFAAVGRAFRDPARVFEGNVLSTTGLVEAFLEHPSGARPRLLLASSSAVYGRVPDDRQPIRASEPVAPVSPYGLSKAMAEDVLAYAARHGFATVVARFFNTCGFGQGDGYVLADFARAFRARVPLLRIGRLDAVRDFLDVRDAAEAVALLAEKASPGEVVNVGSGRGVSLEWAIDRLIAVTGHRPTIEYDPTRARPSDVARTVAEISRLAALGFVPRRALEDTIAEMAR